MENILKDINQINNLTYSELISLKKIVEERIVEYKREQILNDANQSQEDFNSGKLKSYSNTEDLINDLNK